MRTSSGVAPRAGFEPAFNRLIAGWRDEIFHN
jgi:hypothetical protein